MAGLLNDCYVPASTQCMQLSVFEAGFDSIFIFVPHIIGRIYIEALWDQGAEENILT
jgi:hypothetical protein